MSLYSWLSIGPDDLLWTGIGMTKRKHQLLTESERDQILAIPSERDHLARLIHEGSGSVVASVA